MKPNKLKFRIWDEQNKKMIQHNEIWSQNWSLGFFAEVLNGEYPFIVMRGTEVRSTDGIEIFEGDIVVADSDHKDECLTSDIIFNEDGGWQIRAQEVNSIGFKYQHGLPIKWGGWNEIKIIGNVYEDAHIELKKTNV